MVFFYGCIPQDWQSAGLKKPSWVDLGNIYRFPKVGLKFKEIGHLSKLDQPELFTRNSKIPIKHMIQVLDGDFTFSPFKCRKRASALV